MGARSQSTKLRALFVYIDAGNHSRDLITAYMHLEFHSGLGPEYFEMEGAASDVISALGDTAYEWALLHKSAKYYRLDEFAELKAIKGDDAGDFADMKLIEWSTILKQFMDIYKRKHCFVEWDEEHLQEIGTLFTTARGVKKRQVSLSAEGKIN